LEFNERNKGESGLKRMTDRYNGRISTGVEKEEQYPPGEGSEGGRGKERAVCNIFSSWQPLITLICDASDN